MSSALRIGLISDTHGLLRNEVYAAFEGADEILHEKGLYVIPDDELQQAALVERILHETSRDSSP